MGRDRKFSFSSKPKEEVPLLDIKQVGLLNLGNSCFYNTVVQTLTVTRPLASLIADPPPSSPALALISPASTAFNPDPESYPSPLPISSALVSTLAKLAPTPEEAKTQPKTFNPKALLRELSRKHEEYAQATQQDSHELLRHLIDGIYMEEVDLIKKVVKMPQGTLLPKRRKRSSTVRQELNRPVEGSAAVPLTENGTIQEEPEPLSPADEEAAVEEEESTEGVDADEEDEELEEAEDSDSDESTSSSESDTSDDERSEDDERKIAQEKKEKKAKKKLRPFIDSVFGGKLASVVICDECKNVSLTREDFMDLSLSLKDDDAKMRKRDRIRRSLQAGFFSKKDSKPATPAPARPEMRRQPTSLSEAELSSASEIESDSHDEEGATPPADARLRARRLSLAHEPGRPGPTRPWVTGAGSVSVASSAGTSRDASPLGRAVSLLSHGKSGRRKPKIPKPTHEQLAYIKKVLHDIPGPGLSPLPSQLRWARPPGQSSPSQEKPSSDEGSAAAQSLAQLKLQSNLPDWRNTDLFACLQQFTSVETLEGENSFACKNCWRLLNPDIVERRRQEKIARRDARAARRDTEVETGTGTEALTDVEPVGGDNYGSTSPSLRPREVPSILETGPDGPDLTPTQSISEATTPSPVFSSANASVDSGINGSEASSLDSQLADVEDTGSVSGDESDVSIPGVAKLPLTKANIEALAPPSPATNGASSAGASSAGLSREPSQNAGAPLSTKPSLASVASGVSATNTSFVSEAATNISRAPTPAKQDRHILRKAHKRYLISAVDLPPVLCFHFKRFTQTSKSPLFGTAFANLKKRDDDLSFSQDLDLSPFLAPVEKPPRAPQPGGSRSSRVKPLSSTAPKVNEHQVATPSAQYRLYAVVVHIGTLAGGHYVVYVLSDRYENKLRRSMSVSSRGSGASGDASNEGSGSSATGGGGGGGAPAGGNGSTGGSRSSSASSPPRRWLYTSDDVVRACSVEEVMRSKAYMLFYERVPSSTPAGEAGSTPKSRM